MKKYELKGQRTIFSLEKGTRFTFGSEVVVLEEPALVSIGQPVTEVAVQEIIQGSGLGNYGVNVSTFRKPEPEEEVKPRRGRK